MVRQSQGWALLAAVLGAAVLAAPAQAQGVKYFPKDTEFVVTFDLQNLLSSQFFKDNKGQVDQFKQMAEQEMAKNEHVVKLQQALGFDLFRDLKSITVAGIAPEGPDVENVVFVVEGKFDTAKFSAAGIKAAGDAPDKVKKTTVAGQDVYALTGDDQTIYLTLLDKGTMIVTPTQGGMKQALAQTAPVVGKDLTKLVKLVPGKSFLSFITTKKGIEKGMEQVKNNPQAAMAAGVLQKMEGLALSLGMSADLDFEVGVVTVTPQDADDLAKQMTNGLGFLQIVAAQQAMQNPDLQPLVTIARTLRAGSEGSTMSIRGRVAGDLITENLKKLPIPE